MHIEIKKKGENDSEGKGENSWDCTRNIDDFDHFILFLEMASKQDKECKI